MDYETTITNLVDILLLIFIANHHDFYIYNNRTYAKKIKDLDNSNLFEKLKFLNHHGLEFLSININRNLRNKIAHMDFDIDSDCNIAIKTEKIRIEEEIVKLMAVASLMLKALEKCGMDNLLKELVG